VRLKEWRGNRRIELYLTKNSKVENWKTRLTVEYCISYLCLNFWLPSGIVIGQRCIEVD